MRPFAVLASATLSAAVLTACDGGATEPAFLLEESPTPTATAIVETQPTPTVVPADLESFRAFARQIETAIAEADPTPIMQNALISEYECQGLELELENCYDVAAGTTVGGVYRAIMNSDFVELISPDEVAQHFRDFAAAGSAERADSFGTGEARLYALSWTAPAPPDRPFFVPTFGPLPGKGIFQAVLTSIPSDSPGPLGHPWRSCFVYRFFLEDGRWQLFEEIAGLCEDEWLSGECDICFDQWERWEGAP